MIYFLYGENSYQALRKIREFKKAFSKKAPDFLIAEFDGELSALEPAEFHSALSQSNLFAEVRLVIFKNVLGADGKFFKILEENGDFLKKSRDIFVFWERMLAGEHSQIEKTALTFFKKYSEKTQEVKSFSKKELEVWLERKAKILGLKLSKEDCELMIEAAGAGVEWALENMLEKMVLAGSARTDENSRRGRAPESARVGLRNFQTHEPSPFAFVERMFGPRTLLALKEMSIAGIEPQKFIYAFLWKLKQKKMADAYFNGILAESKMRRDPKNAEEILERFIFSLRV